MSLAGGTRQAHENCCVAAQKADGACLGLLPHATGHGLSCQTRLRLPHLLLACQPTHWSTALCPPLPTPQQHQARLLPARRQRDDCAGALPPGQSHHGGQEEDQRCTVLHRGHGLGADAGCWPPLHVRRGRVRQSVQGGSVLAEPAAGARLRHCLLPPRAPSAVACSHKAASCGTLSHCLPLPVPALPPGTTPTRSRRSSGSASAATRSTASSTSL